jgi:tRNA-2-methylthio-N6-dimethylallyladenosine synthase
VLLADADDSNAQINVQLSLDETYGDVAPVRLNKDQPGVFVSIMRGCDNMCTCVAHSFGSNTQTL